MLFPTLYLTIKKKKGVSVLLIFTASCEISSSESFFGFLPVIFLRQELLFFLQTSSMRDSTGIFCFSEKEKISLHLIPLDQGFLNLWVLSQDYTVKVPAKHFLLCESSKKKFTASANGPPAESPGNLS